MRLYRLFLPLLFSPSISSTSGSFVTVDPARRMRGHKDSLWPLPNPILRGVKRNPTALSNVIFDKIPFRDAQSVFAGANALGFVISLATGSHLHLDLFGTGAFAVAAALPFFTGSPLLPRVTLSSTAVFLWGTKLAGFLFFRAWKVKIDGRLTDTLSSGSGTAMFWTISYLWGVICSLPHTIGTTSSSPGNPAALKVGGFIYVVGLFIESIADWQKWMFKQTSSSFCNRGLWSISQHPNFFGNILVWTGIFIINCSSLVDPEASSVSGRYKRVGVALLSPVFLIAWFYGQANGKVSNTVEMFENRYGTYPGFHEYVENTPLIVPNLFGKQN